MIQPVSQTHTHTHHTTPHQVSWSYLQKKVYYEKVILESARWNHCFQGWISCFLMGVGEGLAGSNLFLGTSKHTLPQVCCRRQESKGNSNKIIEGGSGVPMQWKSSRCTCYLLLMQWNQLEKDNSKTYEFQHPKVQKLRFPIVNRILCPYQFLFRNSFSVFHYNGSFSWIKS